MFTIIVAYNHLGVIGKDGRMPWHNKEDLRHFRATTLHHHVIFGRVTYEGFTRPLTDRKISVVSTRRGLKLHDGDEQIDDFQRFLQEHHDEHEEIFIAGGATIYQQALPWVNKMIISVMDNNVEGDTFFPAWDKEHFERTMLQDKDGFQLETWVRIKPYEHA